MKKNKSLKSSSSINLVLKIPKTVDVSTHSFKTDLENRLAVAYNEAFTREKMITEGNFDPLQKRKRRKRYTQVGDAAVHVSFLRTQSGSIYAHNPCVQCEWTHLPEKLPCQENICLHKH